MAKEIVLSGDALSAAVPLQITPEVSAGSLFLLPADVPLIDLQYGFITKRGRMLSPAARAFMDTVMAVERSRA